MTEQRTIVHDRRRRDDSAIDPSLESKPPVDSGEAAGYITRDRTPLTDDLTGPFYNFS